VFPVRRKRTPSSPLRPAPVPTLSNEQCAPEVHRAGRRSGPAEHRPGTREAAPAGSRSLRASAARDGEAPAGHPGSGPPRDRGARGTSRPGRRPVLRRPCPAGRRNHGTRGEPPPIRWLRSLGRTREPGGFASRGRRGLQGPERRKAATGPEGPLPEFPPAVRGNGIRLGPGESRGHRGQTRARQDEGQSGPGRTGEPPGANRPRLVRGGNGGAGEQEPRAPGAPGRCAHRGSPGP